METFSKHQDQLCKSSEFWRMCLEELKPLVVGFQHTNNEIKQAADLISKVSPLVDPVFKFEIEEYSPPVISSDFLVGSIN